MNGHFEGGQIAVLLVFPDTKQAALGSPGFREVFRTLKNSDNIVVDWGWYNEKEDRIEYECRVWSYPYDIVGFSVPYELLYSNVVRCLVALDMEPEHAVRKDSGPLVLFGGAAPSINPAVAGTIADIVYTGEAEAGLTGIIRSAIDKHQTGAAEKLTPMTGRRLPDNFTVAPRFFSSTDTIASGFFDGFDDPAECTFSDAGMVEIGRGCSRGCRFCAAGHIYLPVRHRSVAAVLGDAKSYRGKAGRIALVGASVSDHRHLGEILRGILDMGFSLTTSSFRADMIDDDIAGLLVRGGLKTITIAPEGGSDRIRRIVNKHLPEENIIDAAHSCRNAGVRNLRLYYMIGLPWERHTDIEAIPTLTTRIRDAFLSAGSHITVSVNPFIPKPQTPFQWCPMAESGYIHDTYKYLERVFRPMSGVNLKKLSVRVAEREAVLSLGDGRVGSALIESVRHNVPWKKALKNNGVDIQKLVYREKEPDEKFPWDAVAGEKTKAALRASYEKARSTAEETD